MTKAEYRPDYGYAWLVVFACFIINFIMAGLVRAAGVLYIALIDVYGVSREVATMPFSLRFCIRNMSGPFVGALGQRYGIRPVVVVGGLVCGLGGIISSLAPSVTWITFAWGGVHGLGYGMCNLIHVIIINRYFDKYKGLALGISYTGDGFGTFILPLLLDFLLDLYGLNGTFLILAGVSLNVVPAAMILKTPPWEEDELFSPSGNNGIPQVANNKIMKTGIENQAFDKESEKVISALGLNLSENIIPEITFGGEKTRHIVDGSNPISSLQVNNTALDTAVLNPMKYCNSYSSEKSKNPCLSDAILLSEVYNLRESASLRVKEKSLKKKRLSCNITVRDSNRKNSQISVTSCPSHIGKSSQFLNPFRAYLPPAPQNRHLSVQIDSRDTRIRSNSFKNKTNNIKNEENLTKMTMQFQTMDNIPLNEKEVLSSLERILDDTDSRVGKFGSCAQETNRPNPVLQFAKTNVKPMFLIICATMALFVFLFISVFTIIIDYAKDNGISNEHGKFLIISFSVTDVIGRILFGIVLDKKWLSIKYYAGLTTGLMGIFILVIPLFKSFVFWMISFSLCGFVQGGTAIMFPVLVEHYMEKNEESVALGCLNFYGGLLMLPVPPMIGFFRDNIGSYDAVFWITGALCIFAGSLWIFEPLIVRKKEDRVCNNVYMSENMKI